MSNELFNQMLSAYDLATHQQKRNATFEVNQQIILAGLYNGGFFNEAAFYGGTCLRIFHGLQRFSEDMDFSLLAPSQDFDFTQYFQPIVDQFAMVGREVEIKKKDKKNFCKVESAFLKDNTDVYDITFQTEKSIKIKIEVDTQPPLKFLTEQKLLLLPQSFMTRCFTFPTSLQARCTPWFIELGRTASRVVTGTILNGTSDIIPRSTSFTCAREPCSSTRRTSPKSLSLRN